VHIEGNTCTGMVAGSSQNNGYGILNYSTVALACKRSVIANNLVYNTGGSGIYCVDVTNLTVSGNTLFDVAKTQTDVSLPVGGISLNGCTNAVASGNVVDTSGKSGIVVAGAVRNAIVGGSINACGNGGVYLRGSGNSTSVKGVTLYDNATNLYADGTAKFYLDIDVISQSSRTGTNGIDLQNVFQSTIKGVSSGNSQQGLSIAAGAHNVVSITTTDNSAQTANTYDGISSQATNTKFVGCRSGNTAGTGQRYGITSTGNYCTLQNNDCTRNQTDGINASGTNVQRSGNRLSTSATPGATQGAATLVAGTVTVSTDEVRTGAGVFVLLQKTTLGGASGDLRVSAVVNATSFTVTSSNAGDTSAFNWKLDQ
jgi:parallel beta-helix repeat protein